LLPSIRQAIPNPVEAYIFVDAGLPGNGATRLDLMNAEYPAWAAQFAKHLKKGGLFPDWSFDDLEEIIPDPRLRRQMVAEIRPRGESFFTEPIPVFSGWPDAPCVYILFSPPYKQAEAQARQRGWITNSIEAGHFHMLVDPGAVADAMIRAVNKAAQG
jgi:hypothetical protein